MTKPYSMDLREKALARVEAGESCRAVARSFGVSPSAIIKWTQRLRVTGSAAPKQIGGYAPRKIQGADADWLRGRVQSGADFTLRGLVAELEELRGLKVDYRTMWSFVRREGLSHKKNGSSDGAK